MKKEVRVKRFDRPNQEAKRVEHMPKVTIPSLPPVAAKEEECNNTLGHVFEENFSKQFDFTQFYSDEFNVPTIVSLQDSDPYEEQQQLFQDNIICENEQLQQENNMIPTNNAVFNTEIPNVQVFNQMIQPGCYQFEDNHQCIPYPYMGQFVPIPTYPHPAVGFHAPPYFDVSNQRNPNAILNQTIIEVPNTRIRPGKRKQVRLKM